MSDANIFIEEFIDVLDRNAVRTASLDKIGNALSHCDELFGKVLAEETGNSVLHSAVYDWASAQAFVFGEWLQGHIPGAPASYIVGEFASCSQLVNSYAIDCLEKTNNELSDMLDSLGISLETLPDAVKRNIEAVATAVPELDGSKTIKIKSVLGNETEMFVPSIPQFDGDDDEASCTYALAADTLVKALVIAAYDGAAGISVVLNENNRKRTLIGMCLVDGAFYQISDKMVENVVKKINKKGLGATFVSDEYVKRSESFFDELAARLAESIDWCMNKAVTEIVFSSIREGTSTAAFSMASMPFVYENVDGEIKILSEIDPSLSSSDLHSMIYAKTHDGCYASGIVQASVIARYSLGMIIGMNNTSEINEEIQDFLSYVELSDDTELFDMNSLALLCEHDEQRSEKNIARIYKEMFDELPSAEKTEIESVVDALGKCSDKNMMIMSIDSGSENIGSNGGIKSYMLTAPGGIDDNEVLHKIRDGFETLCTRSYFGEYTMLIAMQNAEGSDTKIMVSGIKWKRGGWLDLGEDKTLEILCTTNAGTEMGIDVEYDDLEYVTLQRSE